MADWLEKFSVEVPKPIQNRLINLGLPVFGLDFEVKNKEVVFEDNLRVTKNGNFYWKKKPLTVREFINYAVLSSNFYPHTVEETARMINLKEVRIVDNNLQIGNYVIRNYYSAPLWRFFYAANTPLKNLHVIEKIPNNVKVIAHPSAITEIIIKKGPLALHLEYDDENEYSDVWFEYKGVHLSDDVDIDIIELAVDGEPPNNIIKMAETDYFPLVKTEKKQGYKIIHLNNDAVFEFKNAVIHGKMNEEEKIVEKYNNLDKSLIDLGWRYLESTEIAKAYIKRAGAIKLSIKPDEDAIILTFINGKRLTTGIHPALLHGNIKLFVRSSPLL